MKTIKIYAASSLFMALSVLMMACHQQADPEKADLPKDQVKLSKNQMQNMNLEKVELVNEESELTLTGKVSFDEDKIAKVFPLVGGNVIKVNVSLGDYVHKGQVLAVFRSGDISDYQNQYDVAQASLQTAKKNMNAAEELFKTNVYSEKDLLNARNDYKKSTADVNKLKQFLTIYGASDKGDDAEYRVVSPMDGYIVEKNINENMEIRSDNSANIFTVSFLKTVWVLADVYETDLSKVKLHDHVDITTIAYPDRIFKGTIAQISNVLDPVSKVLKIRIVLDNSEGLLKPEMFAVVKVHTLQANKVAVISTKALVFEDSKFHVMVYKNDETFIKRPVTVIRSLGNRTYIKEGLMEGERIVTKGSLLVSNNNI